MGAVFKKFKNYKKIKKCTKETELHRQVLQ